MNGLAIWQGCLQAFIGLAGGLVVGAGVVAFLVALDIIPRLAQVTRTHSGIRWYERAVVLGSVLFTWVDFFDWQLQLTPLLTLLVGLLAGVFVGMLAAALAEVVNVIPILAKRVRIDTYTIGLLMAMVAGKVVGSLVDWMGWLEP